MLVRSGCRFSLLRVPSIQHLKLTKFKYLFHLRFVNIVNRVH